MVHLYEVSMDRKLDHKMLQEVAWKMSGWYMVDSMLVTRSLWPEEKLGELLKDYLALGGKIGVEMRQTVIVEPQVRFRPVRRFDLDA